MKKLIKFLLWLWQFPQNYLAFIICGLLCYNYYSSYYNGKILIITNYILCGFSLGDYIFITPNYSNKVLKHELGHCYQSQLLGWFYIPIIAIPSVLHNIYCRILRKLGYRPDYYKFYTEKWANKLVEKVT